MNFITPPEWKNAGVEPPETLKETGFTAGYKPPAGYFNWFWNKVSACIKEIQEFLTNSSSAITKDITIPATGWVVDTTGFYRLTIADEDVTETKVVTLNLSLESSVVAESVGLRSVTKSVEGGFIVYATEIPSKAMEGTLIIQKGVS